MALPGQTITVRDGGLGIVEPAADKPLYVGVSSAGVANTISTFSSKQKLIDALGYGPVVEAAAHKLEVAGGSVDVLKTASSTAAANSAVTPSGGGPVVTVGGTPRNPYDAKIEVMLGGALGVGRFRYTLDGGKNYSETLVIPAGGTFAIPNTGLTLTFAAGTYVLAEIYSFTSTAGTYNGVDLTAAWIPVMASTTKWPFVVFTGVQASAATAASLAASIAALMLQLANAFRYARAIVDAGTDTTANAVTQFSSFSDNRVMVVYGKARVKSGAAIVGWGNPRVSFAYAVAARCAQLKLSSNPGWVGANQGALNGVTDPDFDERQNGEVLHNNKIVAPTTYIGRAGIYPTNGLLKSQPGSDFKYWQWGRVIDLTCDTVHVQQQPYVNSKRRALTDGTGRLSALDAARINKKIRAALRAVLLDPVDDEGNPGHCGGFEYAVDETNDILTTGILQSSCRVVPSPNAEQIVTDIGFTKEIAA